MKESFFDLTSYLGNRIHHVFHGFTQELSESRVILNWIYALAYLALIFYCAVTNSASHNTAIVTTGSIVSAIFAAYIFGSSYEKVQKMKSGTAVEIAKMDEKSQEEAAGD